MMNPVPWLQMTNMISYQGLVRTFPNTVDKVKITFSSASVDATDSNLLKNTLEGNIGGATDVGVRLVKSDNTNVTLGTPITINFPTTNSY